MTYNFNKKENLTMETFKETMSTIKDELDMYYNHLDECINQYIKGNAEISADEDVNHLTFYAFTYEYLNYLYGLLRLSYGELEKGRTTYMEGVTKFGMTSGDVLHAFQYINIATIKYNAFDDMCKLFENAFYDAEKYLKNGCKCGMKFQDEKLPEPLPVLVIESLKKYERN